MLRYIATTAIAVLLLAVALRSRREEATGTEGPPAVIHATPDIEAVRGDDGTVDLKLRHRFAGAVSRASLVYELEGDECTLDKTSNCQQSLDASSDKVKGDGYSTEITLGGHLPQGYSRLRLVLEDETGTRVLPVDLNPEVD